MTTTFALFIVLLAYCNAKAYGNRDKTIRKNFHGLFDSVAANNSTSVDFFKKSLTNELDQESQKFGALKNESRARRVDAVHGNEDQLAVRRRDIETTTETDDYEQLWQKENKALNADIKEDGITEEKLGAYYRRKLLRCRVEKKQESAQYLKKQGAIETEKEQVSEYAALVVVRCQIEHLEHTLFPYELYRNPRSRYARWIVILRTKGTDRDKYRKVVLTEYKKAFPTYTDQEIEHLYANVMRDVYSDLSDASKGPHLNVDAVILKRVHRVFSNAIAAGEDEKKEEPARRYITLFGLTYEPRYITAMVVVSSDMSFTEGSYKTGVKKIDDPSELSCILITAELHKDTLPNVKEADVNAFFPSNEQPTKVIISSAKKRSPKPEAMKTVDGEDITIEWADQIIAKFKDCDAAMNAFDKRQRQLKNQQVHAELIPCPAEGPAAA